MSGLSCPLGAHGIQSRCLWDATQPSQFSFVVEAIKQVVQVGVSEILGRATGPTDIGASAASVAVNRALAIAPLGHQTLESPSFLRGEFPLGADLGELRK